MKILLTLALSMLCLLTPLAAQNTMPSLLDNANAGTEFVFSMPPCYNQGGNDNKIVVYVSSPYATEVKIEVPGRGIVKTQRTVPNDVIFFSLSPAEAQPFNKSPNQTAPSQDVYVGAAVVVTSKEPIVAYAVTRFQFTTDAIMLTPTSALGTEYVVGSMADMSAMYPGLNLPSEVTVAATADDTKVFFTLGGNALTTANNGMKAGQTRSYTLRKGDVVAISSVTAEGDVSGSYVRSTKPVSVVSGNQCANVPTSIRWCDYIVSAETPISAWSTRYHYPQLMERNQNSWMKIFAASNQTNVRRNGEDFGLIETGRGGVSGVGYLEGQAMDGEQQPIVFTADKPISIKVFNPGQELDNRTSDPYAIQLVPVDQYVNYVWFNAPGVAQQSFAQNWISLIYVVDDNGTLPGDLELGMVESGVIEWVRIVDVYGSEPGAIFPSIGDGKTWAEKRLALPDPSGVYAVRSASEPFTVYSYGADNYDTYGFRTGARMVDLVSDDTLPPHNEFQTSDGLLRSGRINDVAEQGDPSGLAAIRVIPETRENFTLEIDDFVPGTIDGVQWTASVQNAQNNGRVVLAMIDRRGNTELLELTYEPEKETNLDVTPEFDFGTTIEGEVKEATITIVNTSDSDPVVIESIELTDGAVGFELVGVPTLPYSLAAGGTLELTARWTAGEPGNFSDVLLISTVGKPVAGYTVLKAYTAPTGLTFVDRDFFRVEIGEVVYGTGWINNNGEVDANIIAIDDPTDDAFRIIRYSGDISSVPGSLESGGTGGVDFEFTPTEEREYTATVTVRYQFGQQPEQIGTINLIGEGFGSISNVAEVPNIFGASITAQPNPTSRFTTLNFELPTPQLVAVRVFDLRGNVVFKLPSQAFESGVNALELDLATLASGTYYCQLEARGAQTTLPILVRR